MTRTPTLFVMVGLPGSGKTTLAHEVEEAEQALRLSPDEWMMPLFGEAEADGARDVLEGRFVWLARRALRRGVSVVLDFGVWGKDERTALRHLAASAGASCRLLYLAIDEVEQRRRVQSRYAATPDATAALATADLTAARGLFEVPDEVELAGGPLDPPPDGHASWDAWAAGRWPTSTG